MLKNEFYIDFSENEAKPEVCTHPAHAPSINPLLKKSNTQKEGYIPCSPCVQTFPRPEKFIETKLNQRYKRKGFYTLVWDNEKKEWTK